MQDLLDRAYYLHLPSAYREVLARRSELESGETPFVDSALIDALDLYVKRQFDDVIQLVLGLLADSDRMPGSLIAYSSALLVRCYAIRGRSIDGLKYLESPEVSKHFIGPLATSTYYWLLANFLRQERRFNEAKDALQRAHELVLISTVPRNAFRIVSDIANVHLVQGDGARAITLYEGAISEFEHDPDFADALIRARLNLASAYQRINRDEDAFRVYDELLRLPGTESEWGIFIAVKLNKAIALKALKRMDESFEAYTEVRVLARDKHDTQFELRALIGLSDHCRQMDRLTEARAYADEALAIATEKQARPFVIESKRMIASVERDNGNREVAAQIMRECFDQLIERGDNSEAINIAQDLVDCLSEAGHYKEALEINQESVKIQQKIYEGEIERSIEISSVRESLSNQREAVRARDEERTKVLHAVMPAHIANRLTAGERQIVDTIPAVTILFADVVRIHGACFVHDRRGFARSPFEAFQRTRRGCFAIWL
ncbi:MAG: tetratricopeptide repeat protein [Candidatus Kapabacteria bacterium]|nr:tetratricopeptide repeat protein [Candidatus Kapabacteria bacterium]